MTNSNRNNTIAVTLELPPHELHQNARIHWRTRAKAVDAYRRICWAALNIELRKQGKSVCNRWPHCRADVTFVFHDRRRRDVTNYLAAMKSAWDGFEDAGLVEDDCVIWFGQVVGVIESGKSEVRIVLRNEAPPSSFIEKPKIVKVVTTEQSPPSPFSIHESRG